MTPLLAGLIGYLAVQLAIGFWASRRVRSEDDYLLAGRRLGPGLATFSIFATWFGAETCIGAAGRAHARGLSSTSAEPFGYGLCLLAMGVLYAVPLWRRKLTTFADLYGRRFSPVVERTAAVLLVPGSILWAAAQMRGFGHVLTTAAGFDSRVAVAVAAGFCILYTVFGGLLADATNDLVQGIVLTIGLSVLAVAVVMRLGGPAHAAGALVGSFSVPRLAAEATPLLGTLEAWAIPVFGSALATELVSRVIACRSPEVARRSSLLAGAMYIAVGSIPVAVGLLAHRLAGPVADAEQVLPAVAREVLPAAGYVLFAGALVAAILSTVDSTLLVAAGLVSHNLLVPAFRIESQRTKVLLARAGVATFGVLAWWLASGHGVFELVEQASALGSSGTFVAATFGLFTPWGGSRTALATLVVGPIVYAAASAAGWETPFLASLA
ncbi:MAG: sodium:solute symporter family protein, partial [Anaeromyxobacteraceae bacterium]